MNTVYEHDFPKLAAFHAKYALGEKGAVVSCLCCGQEVSDEPAVSHAELYGIVICRSCKHATAAVEELRGFIESASLRLHTEHDQLYRDGYLGACYDMSQVLIAQHPAGGTR